MYAMPALETIEFPRGDYVSPGLARIKPDVHFPNMIIGDKGNCGWEYLRREVDHNWYVDRRWPSIGFLDRDEAHILYNSALQFRQKRALEIGCWLGWSACHIALAGMDIDVIDPLLADSRVQDSVTASLSSAAVSCDIVLVPGKSPEAVLAIAGEQRHKWSFIFIDGDHRHPSPVLDARAASACAEENALILFHDVACPDVGDALEQLRTEGWNIVVYQTMQIMAAAWRGSARPIAHTPDPRISWTLPEQLRSYPLSESLK
jgi:predicted O-methyltransferase YrrM